MAKKYYFAKKKTSTPPSRNKRVKSQQHRKDVTSLAFKMGCVERGLKNPDSQISASYNAGLVRKEYKKKPLY